MTLSEIEETGTYRVKRLHSIDREMHRHLEDMGFIPGERINVVSRNSGNLIVSVKGSRVALSRELASNIVV